MHLKLPEYVQFTLSRLEQNGYGAYLVGGCVRDFLMGICPHDYDITTSACPDEIQTVFNDVKTLDIGKKHGTITLVFDKECVEVTTYRIDGKYSDSRHPENVTFTPNIEYDLARRDFTINAIAYSPSRSFCDCFGGRADIQNKILRCVGNADERFCEDALRILRCLRFASRLGFDIEENTKRAVFSKMHLLCNIAHERKTSELLGMLSGEFCDKIIDEYFDVLCYMYPCLCGCDKNVLSQRCKRAVRLDKSISLACLFSFADIACLKDTLLQMKLDNKTVCKTLMLVENISNNKTDEFSIKKNIFSYGLDNTVDLYSFLAIIYPSTSDEFLKTHDVIRRISERNECVSIKQLEVNGDDFVGKCSPKSIGSVLNMLLFDVMSGKCENDRYKLLSLADSYIKHIEENFNENK